VTAGIVPDAKSPRTGAAGSGSKVGRVGCDGSARSSQHAERNDNVHNLSHFQD